MSFMMNVCKSGFSSHAVACWACLLFAAGILSSCSPKSEAPAEVAAASDAAITLTAAQQKALVLTVGAVQPRAISQEVRASGMLDAPPQNVVSISAPLGGFVKSTKLLQGMTVKAGEVLAVVEDAAYIQLQQDYQEANSRLTVLRQEFERQQQLVSENVGARQRLQEAEAAFKSTQAQCEGLAARLRLTGMAPEKVTVGPIQSTIEIRSPISGYVTQVHVNIGKYVTATDVMFRIVNTDHLHAELFVYERDLPTLRVGQPVFIQLSNETKERSAKVYLVGKEISEDRTIRVHAHLDREDPSLIPGLFFTARIETANHAVDALPETAFVYFEGKDYVFLPRQQTGSYQPVAVTKGMCIDGFCEVGFPNAIPPQIVISGAYQLLSVWKNRAEE
jgi:cobalt-zinc-cadmium efflux system membrane fusion protein